MSAQVHLKRAYEPAAPEDGYRVLVDRYWPRGVTRDALHADIWLRAVAPGDALRRWFGHRVERWPEFRRRYRAELVHGSARPAVEALLEIVRREPAVTLVYGARDPQHNQAVVLREVLETALGKGLPVPQPNLAGAGEGSPAADPGMP